MTLTPAVSPETFTDAWETVQTALALGMEVEAPAGLVLYRVTLYPPDGDDWPLGLYPTEAAARTRLRNWVLENYGDTFRECLEEEDGQRDTTDIGIINWHFSDASEHIYNIEKETVSLAPSPTIIEWEPSDE